MATNTQDLYLNEAVATLPGDLSGIGAMLSNLARGSESELNPFLHCVETHSALSGASGLFHCHVIKLDGNGRVRLADLMTSVANAVVDYAIPRSQIRAAFDHYRETKSSARVLALAQQARELFVEIANTGEGGELLLFLFAEKYLKLPQILCKMNLKTSGNVHFHGSDGRHVGVSSPGSLDLYWSESKVYSSISSGLSECMKSLAGLLTATGASGSRDLQLVGNYIDLDSPQLEAALKSLLDPSKDGFNKVQYRGLCLVGFDSDHYPEEANKKTLEQVIKDISGHIPDWKEKVASSLSNNKIHSYIVHVFCLPVPSAEEFRAQFLKAIG